MLDTIIDALIAYLNELKIDSIPTQLAHIGGVLVSFAVLYVVTFRLARRRYRKDNEDAAEQREQLKAAREDAQLLRKEHKKLEATVAALEDIGPTGFLANIKTEQRDGNFEPQVSLSESFLNNQQQALHQAFAVLAHASIGHAVEDGVAGYENALLYARAPPWPLTVTTPCFVPSLRIWRPQPRLPALASRPSRVMQRRIPKGFGVGMPCRKTLRS